MSAEHEAGTAAPMTKSESGKTSSHPGGPESDAQRVDAIEVCILHKLGVLGHLRRLRRPHLLLRLLLPHLGHVVLVLLLGGLHRGGCYEAG